MRPGIPATAVRCDPRTDNPAAGNSTAACEPRHSAEVREKRRPRSRCCTRVPTPTATPTRTPIPIPTRTQTLSRSWTQTPTRTQTQTPTLTQSRTLIQTRSRTLAPSRTPIRNGEPDPPWDCYPRRERVCPFPETPSPPPPTDGPLGTAGWTGCLTHTHTHTSPPQAPTPFPATLPLGVCTRKSLLKGSLLPPWWLLT